MNFYPFHIGDYTAHTARLSLMEDLAYRRMIDAYYLAERPFNGCAADVAREIGMVDQVAAVEYVLKKFFEQVDGEFHNKRCDKEIAHYQDKKTKASNAGKASVERRLGKKSTSVEGLSTDVQLTNNHEPRTKNQEKNTESQPDGFDSFWSAYPKKVAKPAAQKAFKAAKINGHLPEVLADIEAKSQSDSWLANKGQFIPNPATYLNQRRWEDQTGQQSPQVAGAI